MAILANLSRSGPVTAPSLEALCLMRSIARPLVRERHTRSARPFAIRARGRRALLEALSLMRSIPLPLVRARGRALQNCVRTVQGQSECFSIGEKPSGSGRLRARRRLFHWRGPPKAPRQWQSRWIAHAPRANRFAVRAPCAHPRKSIGKALGKALPKTRRHRRGGGQWLVKGERFRNKPFTPSGPAKGLRFAPNFFQLFSRPPLRSPFAFAKLANVSDGPGLPKRRGVTLFPLRIERKER